MVSCGQSLRCAERRGFLRNTLKAGKIIGRADLPSGLANGADVEDSIKLVLNTGLDIADKPQAPLVVLRWGIIYVTGQSNIDSQTATARGPTVSQSKSSSF